MPLAFKRYPSTIGVIDIFAGPGGLGEGFSNFKPNRHRASYPFELAVSAEMEQSAHATLRLRAFYRLLLRQEGHLPNDYWSFLAAVAAGNALPPSQSFGVGRWEHLWREAEKEALHLTLGIPEHNKVLFERIQGVRNSYDELVLIGGPPCQAYSLVGRARQAKVSGFRSKGDPRHFLYKQYLEILATFKPAVFIMENVKGILTSKVGNQQMLSAIREDLSNPSKALALRQSAHAYDRYILLPIHVPAGTDRTTELVADDPSRFVIRCENHGIPQARHRVIIMGVREDYAKPHIARIPGFDVPEASAKIEQALAGLPALRSGLSRKPDDEREWLEAMHDERRRVIAAVRNRLPDVARALDATSPASWLQRSSTKYAPGRVGSLAMEIRGERASVVLNHEARGHMKSDLGRYMFCAAFGEVERRSPTSSDFPKRLAPEHQNWDTGAFADRFRVQIRGAPSSTITSHLSKDGHAFIHWDPAQCRSLTVREAARIQTFPDDYLFLGNRTQQFVQVGNAVPPMVARQIANVVYQVLCGA